MTMEKNEKAAERNKQWKVLSQKYWYRQYFSTAVLVLVLVSAILYCQSTVIGIDNSFHEYC